MFRGKRLRKIVFICLMVLMVSFIWSRTSYAATVTEVVTEAMGNIAGTIVVLLLTIPVLIVDCVYAVIQSAILGQGAFTYDWANKEWSYILSPANIFSNKFEFLDITYLINSENNELAFLQNAVSTTYFSLRIVALVGLLSILVYIRNKDNFGECFFSTTCEI